MCQQILQSLFGGGQQPAAPKPVAVGVTRDARTGGQVKSTVPTDDAPVGGGTGKAPAAGNISIGGAIGQADGIRKRTTELGL